MNKTCYNCNTDISKESTKEHIPARNLFEGFNERQTNNITVLSCYKCNNDYSKIDEKFMHFIGFISNNNDNKILLQKVMEKYFKTFESKVELLNNPCINSPISESELINYHKKNFKGLMMNDFKIYIPDNDNIRIDIYELTKKKYPYLFNSLNSTTN